MSERRQGWTLEDIASLAVLSPGTRIVPERPYLRKRFPLARLVHFEPERPLTKRQRRRLRGKAKAHRI